MKILNKLRSRSGASLLIAMVFMMICAFVGGSVLAASTANTLHIKALTTDQQKFLCQRSATMLLRDELKPSSGHLRLTVLCKNITTQHGHRDSSAFINDGEAIKTEEMEIVIFQPAENAMQRLLLESAVLRCAEYFGVEDPTDIQLTGFSWKNGSNTETLTSVSQFWLYGGGSTIRVNDPISGQQDAMVQCTGSDEMKSFIEAFKLNFGEETQMTLTVKASVTEKSLPGRAAQETLLSDGTLAKVSSSTKSYIVDWKNPRIEKGGKSDEEA